jgi:hypothetical protein
MRSLRLDAARSLSLHSAVRRRMLTLAVVLAASLLAAACGPFGGPQLIQSAVLGGMQAAFDAKYGAPAHLTDLGPLYLVSIQGTATALNLFEVKGVEGQAHVSTVGVLPPPGSDVSWDNATASKVSAPFVPSDAQLVSDMPGTKGTLHIYRSAALAATFSADLFVKATDHTLVAPGTFTIACESLYPSQAIPICLLRVGVFDS